MTPATARPVPTMSAVSTRGRRSSMTIVSRRLRPGLGDRPAQQVPGEDGHGVGGRDRRRCPGRCPRRSPAPAPRGPRWPARPAGAAAPRGCRDGPLTRSLRQLRSGHAAGTAERRVGREAGQLEVGMDGPGQGGETLRQARSRPRDGHVVDRPDGLAGDRRHLVPAGSCRDIGGTHAVLGVAQDDDLGVGLDEALEGHLEGGRIARRDGRAAGELDHVGHEGVRRGPVRRALEPVQLVERPRRAARRRRGGRDGVELSRHLRRSSPRRRRPRRRPGR